MANSSREPAGFSTQANALFRKNLAFQKRNFKTNLHLVCFPVGICLLLLLLQNLISRELNTKYGCGCSCVNTNGNGTCENVCGIQYSTLDQAATCAIPSPPQWPPLMQVPLPEYRSVLTDYQSFLNLPDMSCRRTLTCPVTVLFTGKNRSFAESVASNFFTTFSATNLSDILNVLPTITLGTDTGTTSANFIEPAFFSARPLYTIQPQCRPNSSFVFPVQIGTISTQPKDVKCVQALNLWRNSLSSIKNELYEGHGQMNSDRLLNEIMAAYDFLNSNTNIFIVNIWYNSTYQSGPTSGFGIPLLRVARSINLISNAFLRTLRGSATKMEFEFTKEMPKPATKLSIEFSSILGPLFFKWVIELLFPVLLTYLVYEKEHKLRIMMKMHGLGDAPYVVVSYAYFLFISSLYVIFLVVFSSLIGLKFFTANDYGILFVFFFAYVNLQIALAFLMAMFFSNVKTAQAIGYIYIFGSGLLAYLLQSFIEDATFSRHWIQVMELVPAFSLYHGLYEFGQYSFDASYMGMSGMLWRNLNDEINEMKPVLVIIIVEWLVMLLVAYYLDQKSSLDSRIRGRTLLQCFHNIQVSLRNKNLQKQVSKTSVDVDKPDVILEREVVEQFLVEPTKSYAIVSDNLRKIYLGRDGNPDKIAVQGLSLALPYGECFGMLGPNGAGKTSFIDMMIGLVKPSSGNAYVDGFSIQSDMENIYTQMGVCPQHDMLWESLTGREHLQFYGRLKNLKGSALIKAVEESLKSINLFHGGIGDKQVQKYSGGMKRRLSVAISLIGDPKIVYMDEPSSGLDPASRNNLWNVVKQAKQNRAIILTTHSMEEAEVLCDRLGIFVDGSLQCIGNPKQLKARYGGSYVLTMTTSSEEEKYVENLVHQISPNAKGTYHMSGTQKFEIPKQDVNIADIFQAVEDAKRRFPVKAWGLADTTLEDVFIKVARGAESPHMSS